MSVLLTESNFYCKLSVECQAVSHTCHQKTFTAETAAVVLWVFASENSA